VDLDLPWSFRLLETIPMASTGRPTPLLLPDEERIELKARVAVCSTPTDDK
jgi:hypothetical protein